MPARSELKAAVGKWIEVEGLPPSIVKNLDTVVTWVDLCAPRNAREGNLLLGCKELLVVFYSLDDCERLDCLEYFDACSKILLREPYGGEDPLLSTYASVIAEIEELAVSQGYDTSYYRAGRLHLIDEYRWRLNVRTSSDPQTISEQEYLQRRRITIYTQQWVDLWDIIEGTCLSPEMRKSPEVEAALEHMIEWQLLQNDLVSLERDNRVGELNLVQLVNQLDEDLDSEVDDSDEYAVGKLRVAKMRDDAYRRLKAALETLRAGAEERMLVPVRYCEILEQCLHGTIINYQENLRRYDIDPSLLQMG